MADTLVQPSLAQDPNVVALTELAERITYLDVSQVITHDIDRVPASALSHLADQFHMRHTVAWRRTKTDTERRSLVKEAVSRHRLKGTLAGLRLAARDAGANVIRAVVPPARLYLTPALSITERNAFVSRHPQLRIYRHRTAGLRVGLHLGSTIGLRPPCTSDAVARMEARAWLWRDGTEMPLTVWERQEISTDRIAVRELDIAMSGQAGAASFAGHAARYLVHTDAAVRLSRVRLTQPYLETHTRLHRNAVTPGLRPIDAQPDIIAEQRAAVAGVGILLGRTVAGCLAPTTVQQRLYERLYLFEPSLAPLRRYAASHLGVSRLGMPAHCAELTVRISGRRSRHAVARHVHGHLISTPPTALDECLEAMRDASRASDRIAIDTAIARTSRASWTHKAGSLLAGAIHS